MSETLTLEHIEQLIQRMSAPPTHIAVSESFYRHASRLAYWKPPVRKVAGMRKRKQALYWRTAA